MKKKVIKLNENDIENLVKKIIKEEDKKEKVTTLTRHPAYPIIDDLEMTLDELKTGFKRDIANSVSGTDGYHSEIDTFVSNFNKFIGKVSDLKGKINDHQIAAKKKKQSDVQMQERKKAHWGRKEQARNEGNKYSY